MIPVPSAARSDSLTRTAQLQFVLQSTPVHEGPRTSTGGGDLRRYTSADAGGSRAADFNLPVWVQPLAGLGAWRAGKRPFRRQSDQLSDNARERRGTTAGVLGPWHTASVDDT